MWFFVVILLGLGVNPILAQEGIAEPERESQALRFAEEIQRSFANQMEQELHLRWDRHGDYDSVVKEGAVEELSIRFLANRRANVAEARALLLLVLDRFLQNINTHEKIQSYLQERPFTIDRVRVFIDFVKPNGWGYLDGSVADVFNRHDETASGPGYNKIVYSAIDPFKDLYVHPYPLEETYHDALRLNAASPIKDPSLHEETELEEEMDSLLGSFKKEMEMKQGLYCWAIGGNWTFRVEKGSSFIEEIGAKFNTFYPASQEEARDLIVLVAERLVRAINHNEKLKPYLLEPSFPASRLKLLIEFRDRRYRVYYDGPMESVVLDGNIITYTRENSSKRRDAQGYLIIEDPIIVKESYPEAIGILKKTPPHALSQSLIKKKENFSYWVKSTFEDIFNAGSWVLFTFVLNGGMFWVIPLILAVLLFFGLLSGFRKRNEAGNKR